MRAIGAVDGRWVVACAIAETVGMTAAATAARIGSDIADGGGAVRAWLALGVVVVGGLVEGTALGVLQGRVLATRWPALARDRFLLMTVLVAGIGWAAASAPGVLGGDSGAAAPPLVLILLGALGIGLVMGPVLGAAQVVALRGAVAHPWRWVAANTAAWPPVMALIFLGASTAGAGWPTILVAGYGAVTGAVAGTVLGVVSGFWLGSLDGQAVVNRLVLALVARQQFGIDRKVVGLAVRGRRTGGVVRFPVEFARHRGRIVVVPSRPEHKAWWRNVGSAPTPMGLLDGSGWHPASGRLLEPGTEEHDEALAAFCRRWPQFRPSEDQPVVVLSTPSSGIATRSAPLHSVG